MEKETFDLRSLSTFFELEQYVQNYPDDVGRRIELIEYLERINEGEIEIGILNIFRKYYNASNKSSMIYDMISEGYEVPL